MSMTEELTFVTICTATCNAAAFGIDRSRTLKYAGRPAQLCSSARHAEHALLDRFRLFGADLEHYTRRSVAGVMFQV